MKGDQLRIMVAKFHDSIDTAILFMNQVDKYLIDIKKTNFSLHSYIHFPENLFKLTVIFYGHTNNCLYVSQPVIFNIISEK